MAKEIRNKKRRPEQKNSIPISWSHERSLADQNEEIEGVGRAGAPIQSLEVPGVSDRSTNQTRELGTTRLRISRPGVCVTPLDAVRLKGQSRRKTK
jgi:hypothetical protein